MSLRPNSKADAQKQRYKVAVDTEEARRKREENMVEIRKSKREESLLKKRREAVASAPDSQSSIGYDQTISLEEKLRNLPEIVSALASHDIQAKEVVIYLRKLLSVENNPPIDAVILSGAVPPLVDILRMVDIPQLQFKAAWTLTNIVSETSEHTKVVIDYGALPIFVELLTSLHDNVREQAVWALGNIVGDSAEYRDLAIDHGALEQVLAQFNETAKITMIRNATWALSNFFRGKPQPVFDQVKYALPTLWWLLHVQDDDVLANACWALSYLFDGPNLKIQAVINAGNCPKLVELLSHPSPLVLIPSLRTVGNIVTGNDLQTQVIIDNEALRRILTLLTTEQAKKTILKEACWTISNINAGTREPVQAMINANIFPSIIFLLANAEFDIKKEAAWAVSNATSGGTDEQIKYLVSLDCIKPLCDLLYSPDPRIITVCLEGLQNILKTGEAEKNLGLTNVNVYVRLIEDVDGLDKIENLQSHENIQVYQKAVRILENYLVKDDEDEMLEQSEHFRQLHPSLPML